MRKIVFKHTTIGTHDLPGLELNQARAPHSRSKHKAQNSTQLPVQLQSALKPFWLSLAGSSRLPWGNFQQWQVSCLGKTTSLFHCSFCKKINRGLIVGGQLLLGVHFHVNLLILGHANWVSQEPSAPPRLVDAHLPPLPAVRPGQGRAGHPQHGAGRHHGEDVLRGRASDVAVVAVIGGVFRKHHMMHLPASEQDPEWPRSSLDQ